MAVRSGVVAMAFAGLGSEAARVSKTQNSCGVKGGGVLSNDTGIQIVNGVDAPECAWKWQVGLRFGASGLPFCGGTLINEDWVLTAAHCGNFPDYNIVAGDWKPRQTSGREQNRAAVQLIRHPKYQDGNVYSHDFALVRVNSSFVFNDCVGAACLPETADIAEGSSCMITGWGTLTTGGSQPETLQQGEVNIIGNSRCGSYSSSQIDDSMLCAQGRNSNGGIVDACQGDSGGPLVCETNGAWTLYGATSWGRGCAGADYPGVWARVNYVMDWVNQVLDSNTGPAPPRPTRPRCPDFAANSQPDSDGDCLCANMWLCSVDGVNKNCPTSSGTDGDFGGRYFLPDCDECRCFASLGTTLPPRECPEFAANPQPDRDGDCLCADGGFCSLDGVNKNCPTSSGTDGGFDGNYFLSSCTECRCFASLR